MWNYCSLVVCVAVLSSLSFLAASEKVSYDSYAVVQVIPKSEHGMRALRNLEKNGVIRFWTRPTRFNHPASFQITTVKYESVKKMLSHLALNPTILIDNIQELIDKQDYEINKRKQLKANEKAFDLGNFHRYDEILGFLKDLATNNSLVTYSVIGKSYDKRDIGQVVIKTNSSSAKQKIFLECGIHAREWVSPSTCLIIIDQLANRYGQDGNITTLLEKFDWIVVPSSNPDGYEYTWTNDRLWRKNRAPTPLSTCTGIDLNRNYDANFGGEGSSAGPCSEIYHGTKAFSEPESVAIRDSLAANRGQIKAYVSIHSNAQLWMSPYGYVSNFPAEYNEMLRVMKIGVEAIQQVDGTFFGYGNEAALLYLTSGTTRDFVYVNHTVVYAYTIECRKGSSGFTPPPTEIRVTAEEVWSGIKAMAQNIV